VVLVNDLIAPAADARLPFGGRKLSGFGATRGREGLLEMTTQKVVVVQRGRWRPHFDEPAQWHEGFLSSLLRFRHSRGFALRTAALRQLLSTLSHRSSKP
ncbi:MAG: aldehyde dehydrogenase family protein, partial [Pseudolabrys sp.]